MANLFDYLLTDCVFIVLVGIVLQNIVIGIVTLVLVGIGIVTVVLVGILLRSVAVVCCVSAIAAPRRQKLPL